MKTSFNSPRLSSPFLLTALVILCFMSACGGGSSNNDDKKNVKSWRSYIKTVDNLGQLQGVPDSGQLIVLRKDGMTDLAFNNWLDSINRKGDINISFFCKSCDSNLMLITGQGATAYISGQTPHGGSTTTTSGPSGEDGPVIYGVNYPVSLPPSPKNDTQKVDHKLMPEKTATQAAVSIAIFDTGLDTVGISQYLYNSSTANPSCIGAEANDGWNFAGNNRDYKDDNRDKHGTVVTHLIIDQINKYGENGVKILPVKIFDASGAGSLFNVLCGLAYARERGAKIVNASFGFYAKRTTSNPLKADSSLFLLKEFVRRNLTNNNILLIAAAGNADDINENKVYIPVNPDSKRNLDTVSFYPASLSRELDNVIPVTTTMNRRISRTQNYSETVVHMGVNADAELFGQQVFFHPFINTKSVDGSSFAAPILTGKITAHYNKLPGTTPLTRADVKAMLTTIHESKHDNAFDDKINGGVFIKK